MNRLRERPLDPGKAFRIIGIHRPQGLAEVEEIQNLFGERLRCVPFVVSVRLHPLEILLRIRISNDHGFSLLTIPGTAVQSGSVKLLIELPHGFHGVSMGIERRFGRVPSRVLELFDGLQDHRIDFRIGHGVGSVKNDVVHASQSQQLQLFGNDPEVRRIVIAPHRLSPEMLLPVRALRRGFVKQHLLPIGKPQ